LYFSFSCVWLAFHVCYMPISSHIPIFLDLIILVVFGVEYTYMKLHSWQFSPAQILSATSYSQTYSAYLLVSIW
jgi:hypothetical protein